MKRDAVDFSRVPERHHDIDRRLQLWGRWIIDRPKPWRVSPMFRQYRSHAWQWHMPEIHVTAAPGENMIIEKAVCALPEKHRTAIRWCYVWSFVPVSVVLRELAVTRDGLAHLIDSGRDMVKNKVRT